MTYVGLALRSLHYQSYCPNHLHLKCVYAHSSNNLLSDTTSSHPAPKLISLTIATGPRMFRNATTLRKVVVIARQLIENNLVGFFTPSFPNEATNDA
jgi:hypothetical protein